MDPAIHASTGDAHSGLYTAVIQDGTLQPGYEEVSSLSFRLFKSTHEVSTWCHASFSRHTLSMTPENLSNITAR